MVKDKYWIGIDPGYTGAVAILNNTSIINIYDMPILRIETGKTKIINFKRVKEFKQEVDGETLSDLLYPYCKGNFVIEKVSSMPEQGIASAFNFGVGYGAVLGVLSTFKTQVFRVPPSKWKIDLGLNSDKNLSIDLALKLFPEAKKYITLKKHNGRAEALLLAYYLKNLDNISMLKELNK